MSTLVQDIAPEISSYEGIDSMVAKSSTSISLLHSFKDWWSCSAELMRPSADKTCEKAKMSNKMIEYELLKAILSDNVYIKDPSNLNEESKDGKINGEIIDVEVEPGLFIHEFYVENNTELVDVEDEIHIVIIHGYMAAFGYFVKNIEQIVKAKPGIRLHVIDLLGFGNSSRPQFPPEFIITPLSSKQKIKQVLDIENWFITRIEEWRLKRKIRKFKLIAHSMGAYLSSCYLMKYNNQYKGDINDDSKIVDQFVIVSPMGTESSPFSLINLKQYQFNYYENGSDPFRELGEFTDLEEVSEELLLLWEHLGKPKFPRHFLLKKLWEYNMSPFQLLQKFGPLYSKILSYWSFQRFRNLLSNNGDLSNDLILKLHKYSYSIFNQYQGSGELAITKLINHEILAMLPLSDRGFVEFLADSKIESLWMYGDKDWMNIKGGKHVYEKITSLNKGLANFKVIENAGHHIYLDNPEHFNNCALEFFNLL